jgi:hypothetical protein
MIGPSQHQAGDAKRPAGGKASKMVRVLYCWRCQMEIPVLKEHEAAYVLERGPDEEFGPDLPTRLCQACI